MDTSSSAVSFKPENAVKILTPWWDVVLKYITSGIIAIALGTLPIQAAKDTLACVVVISCPNVTSNSTQICEINDKSALSTYANLACYDSLDVTEQFYYVLQIGEAFALLFANNIWAVLNPKTSLTLSHFISVVSECYDSVGTPEQVSRILKPLRSDHSQDDTQEMDTGLDADGLECEPDLDNDNRSRIETIFHKVDKFSSLQIESKSLLSLYLKQQFLQVAFPLAIVFVNVLVFNKFNQEFKCYIKNNEFLPMKYEYIACYRYIASFYTSISFVFTVFVTIYLNTAVLGLYFFRTSNTIPSLYKSNDLDFLCFLLDQYSTFQFERYALFDQNITKVSRGDLPSSYVIRSGSGRRVYAVKWKRKYIFILFMFSMSILPLSFYTYKLALKA